jgi:hypothetical protein
VGDDQPLTIPTITDDSFRSQPMLRTRPLLTILAALGTAALVTACDDDDIAGPGAGLDPNRLYNQIERLGNPLVSEVMLDKRDHDFHNDGTPSTDRGNFQAKVERFITTVAGRTQGHATAIAQALLPDMLLVQTAGTAASAGWLAYVFTPTAYGGRRLQDDVVDAGLSAIFGTLVTNDATGQANCAARLCSDFVPVNDVAFSATFPFLAGPH